MTAFFYVLGSRFVQYSLSVQSDQEIWPDVVSGINMVFQLGVVGRNLYFILDGGLNSSSGANLAQEFCSPGSLMS